MAIIATVRQHDTWEGRPTIELKKFIPQHLMVFEGSAGFGGEESKDPIKAAKTWCEVNDQVNDQEGDHILVIDTQVPIESKQHAYCLFPEYHEENDYHLTWEKS